MTKLRDSSVLSGIKIPAPDFDLEKTLDSGQVFHWKRSEAGFVGTVGSLPFYVEQNGSVLKVRCGAPHRARATRVLAGIVARYFSLDHPLSQICASFPNDPVMNA